MSSPVVTAAEMRELDRIAIEDAGIAGVVLMENAGRGVAEVVRLAVGTELDAPIVCVCGKGNNGGDGFVVARYLQNWGYDVLCILVGTRADVTGDALIQLDIVDTLGVEVVELDGEWTDMADDALTVAGVIVDALFGTGLNAAVEGLALTVVEQINESPAPIVSVDLPSGINADTGAVQGASVMADVTVTFGFMKRGLATYPGREFAGEIHIVDVGIPPDAVEHVRPGAFLSELEAPFLPPRAEDSHKGNYGHVVVVGGSKGMSGAALLAGMAALRSGAGRVTVVSEVAAHLEGRFPELMITDHPDIIGDADVIVIGPGLRPDAYAAGLLEEALSIECNALVCDAGALALLEIHPELLEGAQSPVILTPHPGEASGLLGVSAATVQADRFTAVSQLTESGAVVILKGARTLISGRGAGTSINPTGNAGMATAGAGDVLAGVVGAFACVLGGFEAAVAAAYVHGLAGDIAAGQLGQDSLIASDLIDSLPDALQGPEEDDD